MTFDLDANGILNVSAKDKATGKEQSIVIRASSGLSDDEIERMVKDAEAHADEDRRFRELVDARNQADGLIHATNKSLGELGEQVGEQEKGEVEAAIKALETAVAGDDKAEIEAKMQVLTELSGKLAERVHQKSQGGDDPPAGGGGAADTSAAGADDVVDAEFEEVRDDRR